MSDLPTALRDLVEGSLHPVDIDAIVGARRRRRTRRRAAIGTALVVAVAVLTGGVVTRSSPGSHDKVVSVAGNEHESEADATRAALAHLTILSPGGGTGALVGPGPTTLDVTDTATGEHHTLPFPVRGAQSITYPFLVVGSDVVFVADVQTGPYDAAIGTAYIASSDMQQWRPLGPASSALPAVDPDLLWLVADNATPDQRLHGTEYGARRTVSEVDLDGRVLSTHPLTDERSPIAAVTGGLLTSRPAATRGTAPVYEVWDPATNQVVRRLSVDGYATEASQHYVAWTTDKCLALQGCVHVTGVDTGEDHTFAPPRGMQWAGRAFSPDGSRLALVATPPPSREDVERSGLVVPSGTRDARVVVVDLSSGAEATWTTTTWKGSPLATWSPDGALVFLVRDQTHVSYLNPAYAGSPVRELAVDGSGGYLTVEKPVAATGPRYSYDGAVEANSHHSAELCVYPTAASVSLGGDSDSCGGPLVAGWDPNTPNGNHHLVGTYDGHVFMLTQPPSDMYAPTRPPPAPPTFASSCTPPPGGWHVVDESKLTFDTYTAVTSAARGAPDFAGIWMGPNLDTPGVVDAKLAVLNFAFTGNVEAHQRTLAAIYGGPICVVQHPRAYADLQRIAHELIGSVGDELGLGVISIGPDDVRDVVHADVIAAPPALQRELEDRYGAGAVVLSAVLKPVS